MSTMYHVSATDNRSGIHSLGLQASLDETGYEAIFLADECPVEVDGLDVWVVQTRGYFLDEDWTGEPDNGQWWMCFENIPPDRVTLLK